jgi:hypothetical protein
MQSINASLSARPRPGHPEIARLAAQLWEKRGRPAGHDEEIWLQAEQQLLSEWSRSRPRAARLAQPESAGQERFRPKPGLKSSDNPGRTSTIPAPHGT